MVQEMTNIIAYTSLIPWRLLDLHKQCLFSQGQRRQHKTLLESSGKLKAKNENTLTCSSCNTCRKRPKQTPNGKLLVAKQGLLLLLCLVLILSFPVCYLGYYLLQGDHNLKSFTVILSTKNNEMWS